MANVYKEAAKRKKIVPGGAPVVPQGEENEEKVVTPQAEEETLTVAAQGVPAAQETKPVEETPASDPAPVLIDDFDAQIKQQSKQKENKNKVSYTLSPSVIKEVTNRGKKAGLSSSSYLDELLKNIFGL